MKSRVKPNPPAAPERPPFDLVGFFAKVLGSLAAVALILIIVDQTRYAVWSPYKDTQKLKHSLACFQHARTIDTPEGADDISIERVRTERAVYQLMDEARQEMQPTDFWGKLRLFALCSNFSKVGFSGFEVSGQASQARSVARIDAGEADTMIARVRQWKRLFPAIQDDTIDKLTCELARLKDISFSLNKRCESDGGLIEIPSSVVLSPESGSSKLFQCAVDVTTGICIPPAAGDEPCACSYTDIGQVDPVPVEPDPVEPDPVDPDPIISTPGDGKPPEDSEAWKDQWLLVTGADQTYTASRDQINAVEKALTDAGISADAYSVELRLIRSWKRTVAVFASKEDADAALSRTRTTLPYGGYVRNQGAWCPAYSPETPQAATDAIAKEGLANFDTPVRQCVLSAS
ncbi:hypothetical protein [uncultured Tateyamaria sp.]|uniref:hypothetical protein n=1 Tax=uncultured Tateyamaria sp. TaxID=455651 RepID=UPI002629D12D|nr:hypothetical protein [uncultured Tateyamaria sp.]